MNAVLLTLAAGFTSALSGMAGIGGGTILIAVMLAAGMPPVVAIPLHAAVQLASNGSRTVAYLRDVEWRAAGWFLVGAVPAPFLLAPLVAQVNPDAVRLGLAVFILLTLWRGWTRSLRLGGRAGLVLAGVLGAGVGALIGASGTLVAPLLMTGNRPKRALIATLAMCMVFSHALKVLAFSAYGFGAWSQLSLLLPMIAAVIVGTLVGRRLNAFVPERTFQIAFRVILTLLAIKLAWDGFAGLL